MSDTEFSQQAVPLHARKSSLALSAVMLGLTFFSASMWAGGTLGKGLNSHDFFLAIACGNLLLGVYTAALGYIGAKTGLSTHLLVRHAFGQRGAWLPTLILSGTQVGWFGVGVAMFALPVAKATGLAPELIILVAGLAMTLTVFFGMAALIVLSAIAVPAIALFGGYSALLAIDSVGGVDAFSAITPTEPLDFLTAVTMVIGSFISAGTLTADFVRFAKNALKATVITLVAFFLGNSLMFVLGGVGAAATGYADVSDVMLHQGLIWPAIIILGLNIWTTNDNALYAASLGFASVTRWPNRWLSVACGVIGTVLASGLYHHFVDWLTFLSGIIPPIGGVLIVDYGLRRGNYRTDVVSMSWPALGAVACGGLASMLPWGLVPVNAVLGSALAYMVFWNYSRLISGKNRAGHIDYVN